MLQDLAFGRLENEYKPVQPRDTDPVICIRDQSVLACRMKNGALTLPSAAQVLSWGENWEKRWGMELIFAFRLHEAGYYLWPGPAGDCPEEDYSYIPIRQLRESPSRALCYAIMTGWHLHNWYQSSHFCGRCGEITIHDEKERMMRCPHCGNMIFPRINPAIIVGVTDGDRILLTKYAGRGYAHYALIAGFTEIGETLEQTVQREVLEEVGLKVRNIRYYKSQPWAIVDDLLAGFYCDVEGPTEIHMDANELKEAVWVRRENVTGQPNDFSLTNEMMLVFRDGKEPR